MKQYVDIHCHILPYVDDGALRKEEANELIRMEYEQGVRTICFTPHLRQGMFESTDEEIRTQFDRLRERTEQVFPDLNLYLSREYHVDEGFAEKLVLDQLLPLGEGNTILLEFSHAHHVNDIIHTISSIQEHGYKPLIAHLERYEALYHDLDAIKKIVEMGAKVQMNAGSILGREGLRQSRWSKKLLKNKLVHVVASDAHDPESRPPELERCAVYLEKKVGIEFTEELLHSNPLQILNKE